MSRVRYGKPWAPIGVRGQAVSGTCTPAWTDQSVVSAIRDYMDIPQPFVLPRAVEKMTERQRWRADEQRQGEGRAAGNF